MGLWCLGGDYTVGSRREVPLMCWFECFPAGHNCDMTHEKKNKEKTKQYLCGQLSHLYVIFVLLCYWEAIDRRKRKAWGCWVRSLGSDGCCPCDAPSGRLDWLVPSKSHTYRPPLRGVRGAHIYHWGRAVARPGMGHSSPLHARAHPHTHTHWKDHISSFKLESRSICLQ